MVTFSRTARVLKSVTLGWSRARLSLQDQRSSLGIAAARLNAREARGGRRQAEGLVGRPGAEVDLARE